MDGCKINWGWPHQGGPKNWPKGLELVEMNWSKCGTTMSMKHTLEALVRVLL